MRLDTNILLDKQPTYGVGMQQSPFFFAQFVTVRDFPSKCRSFVTVRAPLPLPTLPAPYPTSPLDIGAIAPHTSCRGQIAILSASISEWPPST